MPPVAPAGAKPEPAQFRLDVLSATGTEQIRALDPLNLPQRRLDSDREMTHPAEPAGQSECGEPRAETEAAHA